MHGFLLAAPQSPKYARRCPREAVHTMPYCMHHIMAHSSIVLTRQCSAINQSAAACTFPALAQLSASSGGRLRAATSQLNPSGTANANVTQSHEYTVDASNHRRRRLRLRLRRFDISTVYSQPKPKVSQSRRRRRLRDAARPWHWAASFWKT